MTNSNSNVRRSIGPRKAGEGDPAEASDPLAELTRFMGGQDGDAPRPVRRMADEDVEGLSEPEAHPRRIPRRPFLSTPESEEQGADPDAPDAPEDSFGSSADIDESVEESPGEDDDATGDRLAGIPYSDDGPSAPAAGPAGAMSEVQPVDQDPLAVDAPEDDGDDDPFMQALMDELESDGTATPSGGATSDPVPRVRPSFSFPSTKPSDAPRPSFSRATPTAPAAPATPSVRPEPARPPEPAARPAETERPAFGSSGARPIAPASRENAERVEHARDHDAISSEAAGALEQLRSRLARHGPAAPAADTLSPDLVRPATSWGVPQSTPTPAGEAAPRPFQSRATPVASDAPDRPRSEQTVTAPVPDAPPPSAVDEDRDTPPAVGWERERDPLGDDFRDTAESEYDESDATSDIDLFADEPADTEAGHTDDEDAGWTLDEDALADAIALSVGGHAAEGDEDAPLETVFGDDPLSSDADDGEEGGEHVATDLDGIDFEFDLVAAEPDATADDFRKPAERGEDPDDLPEELDAPLDPDREDAMLAPPPSFVRAGPAIPVDDADDEVDGAKDPDDVDEASVAGPERTGGTTEGREPDENEEDDGPPSVFPALPPKVRRAVPAFRFGLDAADRPHDRDPEPAPAPPASDLDFDLPGLGGTDPWSRWPAASSQAAKTGASGGTSGETSGVADRLSDALFDEDPRQPAAPRGKAQGSALSGADWPAKPSVAMPATGGDAETDDYDDAYDEEDYADDYYDESEPEWDDEHALPPHSLEEMDSALGLSERPRRRYGRSVAAVVLLLLLGGGGYAAYSILSGGEQAADGPPPVIRADTDGVKVMAEGDDADTADGSKAIYDRVGETGTESGRLVRSREEPIDPTQTSSAGNGLSSPMLPKRVRTVVVRPDGTIIPAEELNASSGNTTGLIPPAPDETSTEAPAEPVTTSPAPVAETAPESAPAPTDIATADDAAPSGPEATSPDAATETATDAAPPADDGQETAEAPAAEVLSPIRTSERIVPEPEAAPAPRPAPSEGTRTVSTTRVTSTPQQSGPLSLVPDAGTTDTAATSPSATLPAPARTAAPDTSVGERVSPALLAAQTRRANQQATQAPTQTQTAATQPAATSAPAAASTGDWAVQVSSQRSADQAQTAYRQLQQRFPAVLGGREPSIQSADLGSRGTFYRVRLPTQTREQANQLCAELKAAGGDCFVGRN
ncbi:SPOR domain-containing protein [Amorphus coralli]|uniref:SPOR domain-containing protein n=1 Tax=Amorphus coralli TaxID=340680 RepID=UPI000369B32C|nr:SPOR domain-containing protein [Amorphus coralli]